MSLTSCQEGDLAAKKAPTPKGLVTGKPAACPVLRKAHRLCSNSWWGTTIQDTCS